ncbi:HD domain-containing protein [Clostridiales bacterium COT073_COT-073]|nr:HD domain-containing protein [Clostridiales bacterium COT073_COT-073]
MGREEKAELIRDWIKNEIIEKAKEYIKTLFSHEFSGHDYHHTMRVQKMAERLAKEEGADVFVVGLTALLHDVDDIKLSPDTHEEKENAVRFMRQVNLETDIINRVCMIIEEISFGGKSVMPTTIEGKCVQDADRLDALGAIGIARAFAFGGNHQRQMHHPEIAPNLNMSKEEYRKAKSTTINHFYEKLFRLKALMNTKSGKQIAEQREVFMKDFLEEFMREWDGER